MTNGRCERPIERPSIMMVSFIGRSRFFNAYKIAMAAKIEERREAIRIRHAQQVELLDQAAEVVVSMVKDLRKGVDLAVTREKNNRLQTIEGDADALEVELLTALYNGDYEARQLMFLRDLSDLLEKVIDRCRDAGNVIYQIVLKNS